MDELMKCLTDGLDECGVFVQKYWYAILWTWVAAGLMYVSYGLSDGLLKESILNEAVCNVLL